MLRSASSASSPEHRSRDRTDTDHRVVRLDALRRELHSMRALEISAHVLREQTLEMFAIRKHAPCPVGIARVRLDDDGQRCHPADALPRRRMAIVLGWLGIQPLRKLRWDLG